jgi:hypothetical protein
LLKKARSVNLKYLFSSCIFPIFDMIVHPETIRPMRFNLL